MSFSWLSPAFVTLSSFFVWASPVCFGLFSSSSSRESRDVVFVGAWSRGGRTDVTAVCLGVNPDGPACALKGCGPILPPVEGPGWSLGEGCGASLPAEGPGWSLEEDCGASLPVEGPDWSLRGGLRCKSSRGRSRLKFRGGLRSESSGGRSRLKFRGGLRSESSRGRSRLKFRGGLRCNLGARNTVIVRVVWWHLSSMHQLLLQLAVDMLIEGLNTLTWNPRWEGILVPVNAGLLLLRQRCRGLFVVRWLNSTAHEFGLDRSTRLSRNWSNWHWGRFDRSSIDRNRCVGHSWCGPGNFRRRLRKNLYRLLWHQWLWCYCRWRSTTDRRSVDNRRGMSNWFGWHQRTRLDSSRRCRVRGLGGRSRSAC